jgi:hypothetical protein
VLDGGTASGGRGTGGSNVDTPRSRSASGRDGSSASLVCRLHGISSGQLYIEVELPSGVKLRLTGAVDEAALYRVDRQRVVVTVALKTLSL